MKRPKKPKNTAGRSRRIQEKEWGKKTLRIEVK
jgi:hypothetical protein